MAMELTVTRFILKALHGRGSRDLLLLLELHLVALTTFRRNSYLFTHISDLVLHVLVSK